MNLKKLTQAVFEGLPKEYRWAAVDEDGETYAHAVKPECHFYSGRWVQPIIRGSLALFGGDHDATDWQNSLIERLDVPSSDIDWIEGAAYWCKPFPPIQPSGFFINADFTQVHDGVSWVQALPQVKDLQSGAHSLNVIKRESIHDVARSIEAARVAEQSERTYPHYFKDVSDVDAIDLYHVARLYDITDPALFHAFKKIACAGKRGAKDQAQDVQEAIDALKRWQELNV